MRSLVIFLVFSSFSIAGCTAGKSPSPVKSSASSKTACFKVEGMTCVTCSTTLKASVNKLEGILNVEASSDEGSAKVSYEPSLVDSKAIKGKINSVGYKATERICSEKKR